MRTPLYACRGVCSACLIVAAAQNSRADEQSILSQGQTELRKAAEALRPRPSMETKPVDFSIAGVHYRVPRNYIVTMDHWAGGPQDIVTLRVTLPELKPLDAQTQACLLPTPAQHMPGCQPLDVRIEVAAILTAEQKFDNMKKLFRNLEAKQGPGGLERYDVGPEDARGEFYRKIARDRTSVYSCQTYTVDESRRGFCEPIGDRTADGAELGYFFDLNLLPDIEATDRDLRNLVENFKWDGAK